jgi:hypothetical protein
MIFKSSVKKGGWARLFCGAVATTVTTQRRLSRTTIGPLLWVERPSKFATRVVRLGRMAAPRFLGKTEALIILERPRPDTAGAGVVLNADIAFCSAL